MRGVSRWWVLLVAAGCTPAADRPADSAGAADTGMMMEEAPAGIALVDVAGTWNVRSSLEGSETVVTYDLVATGDRSGWSFQFPGREPIPMRVVLVDGDSIVTEAGPFESALRAGVMVNVRTVSRLQDGRLVGTSTARYDVTGPDTLAVLAVEGTRAP